ncbi:cysteine desulfurase family protein [Cellulomonas dongxiuzhuiae]|uniref:cysteine desulfurase n=1 Tax=Cellulomonas dongxiuzhuiae TaxID=2819979 RepID=A0ABX8GLK3_9CELL|nr:cysteine desulfurase family protein [Cellulomonas dongxiuzhuiae]MBO3090261.1 cysteine desulfurase [Cellulomonas dongxiuzhuiae]MBO3095740.1 cysteine desulfurase [Cellulomonas dongxiuzhuiae]QWC17054.1 cysteine desulfurase [Cellulomonas dongxiuzhuiae]
MSAPRPRAVYLDHAATTPMRPAALSALTAALAHTGNPSSLHTAGRAARRTVEEARERLAAAVGARPSEVVWTAGGTEADNLAVKGLFWARRTGDTARRRVVVSAVEHHAVLDPAFWLAEHAGAELVLLPVDRDGVVEVEALRAELEAHADTVALVSVMWANNEVGALQPLDEVVALAHRHGVPVHADAVQAVGQVPVDLAACGVDALTLSGHKVGGPGSTGALLVRRGLELTPVLHGGGQERGVRSGTLDPALLAAFAAAVDEAVAERETHAARVGALRDDLVRQVLVQVPGATLRGPADPARRLPGNAHLTFAGCEGDSLLYLLDAAGVEASTGSACQAGVPRPSHVLLAMGVGEDDARGALRFSFGATSSADDVDAAVAALPGAVERARAAGLSTLVGA